jgi:hemolysin III
VIYAVQRPNPFPDALGFHGIFHVLVLAGSALHFVFMVRYVAPGM